MSQFIDEKKRLDESTNKSYNELYLKVDSLVKHAASQLPEGKVEILYHPKPMKIHGVIEIEEQYLLTNDGCFEIIKNQFPGKIPDNEMKKIQLLTIIVSSYFNGVCDGLQRIIDKYNIKIEPEKTL